MADEPKISGEIEGRPRPPRPPSGCAYCPGRTGSKTWMSVSHTDDCRRPKDGPQITACTLLCFDEDCDWHFIYPRPLPLRNERAQAIAAYRAHLAAEHSGSCSTPEDGT